MKRYLAILCPGIVLVSAALLQPSAPSEQNTGQPLPILEVLKYKNKNQTTDLGVGLWAWPLPMDYDEDGDMDLIVSCPDVPFNGLYFFENKSGKEFPTFEAPVKIGEALKNPQVSFVNGKPRVLDRGAELVDFLKKGGSNPHQLFSADSLQVDFKKKSRFVEWKLVDYDNDGDEDLMVGMDDWNDYGWDNGFDAAGKWLRGPLHGYVYFLENQNGKYINRGKLEAGGKVLDVFGAPTPNFADFDGDGDLDIICGEFLDKFTWFENTGTREKPVYAEGKLLANAGGIIKMDLEMIIPVAVDWNKDGHVDLIVGDEDGRVAYMKNTGKKLKGMPLFESPVYFKQKPENVKFGALITPVSVDWDGDGDEDIITGNSAGYIAFIENKGGGASPDWAAPKLLKADGKVLRVQAGYNGSIQGPAEAKWGYTTLSVADWDGDGLKDLVVNSIWGKVEWYKNTGTKKAPKLTKAQPVKVDWPATAPKPAWFWWTPEPNTLATQWRTTPFAIDWNKDGMTDLIMLDQEGYLTFYERFRKNGELILKPGQRIFYQENGKDLLRLNERKNGGSGRRKFTLADWDHDGDLDILIDSKNIDFYENLGTENGKTRFVNRGNVAENRLAGHDTSPTTVDWDKDGKLDLVIGAEDGHFYYLKR
jgi:hypothetical protein